MKENALAKFKKWIFGHKNSVDSSIKIYSIFVSGIGFIAIFFPFNEELAKVIPQTLTRIVAILIAMAVLWIVIYLLVRLNDTHCRKEKVLVKTTTDHVFKLQYGDLISILKDKSLGLRSIVIDFNDCFDTIVDNKLVSDVTVHGKILKALYNDGFTHEQIDKLIKANLEGRKIKPSKTIKEANKKYGNRDEYPSGTIANIYLEKYDVTLFLVGMSHFDKDFKVEPNEEAFHNNVFGIISHINSFSQGKPVYMPVIGTGLTRLNMSSSQSVRYFKAVVDTFQDLLPCDLTMVIYDKSRDVDISDF